MIGHLIYTIRWGNSASVSTKKGNWKLPEAPWRLPGAPWRLWSSLGMEFRLVINFDCENSCFFEKKSVVFCQFSYVFLKVGVTKHCKLQGNLLPGSVNGSAPCSWALLPTPPGPLQINLFGEKTVPDIIIIRILRSGCEKIPM